MSIVERAIKKLQQRHQATAVVRSVAPTGSTGVLGEESAAFSSTSGPGEAWPVRRSIRFDLETLRSRRLLPAVDEEREISAQYRHIKRPLITHGIGRGEEAMRRGNALMVTSAMQGEGKTFSSLNLALSMALERQLSVLLVDADVARPRLTLEFGLEEDPGLLDVLDRADLDPESLLVGTDLPTLKLLPVGRQVSSATELLASPRMDEIVRRLCAADPERMIIFDSPPVLPTTEARALAPTMGQILFAVRMASTPQQAVLEALHLLGERPNISLILTHARGAGAGAYYYTSYGYGSYGDGPERASQ